MSSHLNKAMGYGMPWKDFCEASPLNMNSDELFDAFDAMNEANMTVPAHIHIRSGSFSGGGPAILQPSLLSGRVSGIVSGSTLFTIIDPMDIPSHIMFFPNAYYAKKWHRRGDELDSVHEEWREGGARNQQQSPRCYSTYVGYGFYPFNHLMLATGQRIIKWDFNTNVEPDDWLPAVPTEMRWYLPKHNILRLEDVLRLRPLIAQWWA